MSPIYLISTLLGSLTMSIITGINHVVPAVYMDEQFHVDQMAHYCVDDFAHWNAKLSTPPGLYAFTYPLVQLSQLYYERMAVACDVGSLRLLNGVWIVLLHQIVARLIMNGKTGGAAAMSEWHAALIALNVVTMPVFAMTTWLYYTDLLSTITVLLMYTVFAMRRRYSRGAAATAGVTAMCMRQTNVVWVCFVMALDVYDVAVAHLRAHKVRDADTLTAVLTGVHTLLIKSATSRRKLVVAVGTAAAPYACALGLGVAAVARNGGLAYGDKGAHMPCIHMAQLCYLCAFVGVAGVTQLLTADNARAVLGAALKYKLKCLLVVLIAVVCIHFCSYVHPYILADNRHYTFYIWRKLLSPPTMPFMKYALIPGYVIAFALILASLRHQQTVWILGYCLCCALVTVPNLLLEMRYFIIPFMMWRTHAIQPTQDYTFVRLFIELFINVALNCAVLYMFIYKPFEWTHEPGVTQRFMW